MEEGAKHFVEIMTIATAIVGTGLAMFLFLFDTKIVKAIASSPAGKLLTKLWFAAWGFDWLYDKVLVKPYVCIAKLVRKDPVDKSFNLIPAGVQQLYHLLSATQTGSVRWYAATIAAGVVIILAALVLL